MEELNIFDIKAEKALYKILNKVEKKELSFYDAKTEKVINKLINKAEKDIRRFIKDLPFGRANEVSVPPLNHCDVIYYLMNMKQVEIMNTFYRDYTCDNKDALYDTVKFQLRKALLGY